MEVGIQLSQCRSSPIHRGGLLKVAAYGDDPMGTRHLEFEVSVVGDGHKLGIASLSQDGMIGAREVLYLKGEGFFVEVCLTSKHYG